MELTPEPYDDMTPEDVDAELRRLERAFMNRAIFWFVIALAAGLISLASYAQAGVDAAQSETGTGTYYVLWGAVLWGLINAGRNLVNRHRIAQLRSGR